MAKRELPHSPDASTNPSFIIWKLSYPVHGSKIFKIKTSSLIPCYGRWLWMWVSHYFLFTFFFKFPLLSMLAKFLMDFFCVPLTSLLLTHWYRFCFNFRLPMKDINLDHFLSSCTYVFVHMGGFGVEIRSWLIANKTASIIICIT